MNSRTLASFVAGVGVIGHACRPAPTVEAQRAAWQAVRPAAYAFWYQRGCFCPGDGAWIQVVVRGDSVIGLALVSARGAARGVDYALRLKQPTLDGLFEELLRAHAKAAKVQVQFDPRWHFPTQIAVDPIPVAEDDEWQVHIQHFRPLAPTHVAGSPSNSRMQLPERASRRRAWLMTASSVFRG